MAWPSPHKTWSTGATPQARIDALRLYIADIEEEMGRASTSAHGYSRQSAAGLAALHTSAMQSLAALTAASGAGTRLARIVRY